MKFSWPLISDSENCAREDRRSQHLAGLRTVALLELLKGLLALAGGIALITLLHRDIGDLAESVIEHLHINPAHHLAQVLIEKAGAVNENKIIALICAAFAYTIFRMIEAYGLWNARAWAEWLAIISGSAYLPWEIIEVVKHHSPIRWALLLINIVIVLYMVYVRWESLTTGEPVTEDRKQSRIGRLEQT